MKKVVSAKRVWIGTGLVEMRDYSSWILFCVNLDNYMYFVTRHCSRHVIWSCLSYVKKGRPH